MSGTGKPKPNALDNLATSANNAKSGFVSAEAAFKNMSSTVMTGGDTFKALENTITQSSASLASFITAAGKVAGVVPGFGIINETFGGIASVITTLSTVTTGFSSALHATLSTIDEFTGIQRELIKTTYQSASGFGESISSVLDYTDAIMSLSISAANKDFGWIKPAEIQQMTAATRGAKVSIEELTTQLNIGGSSLSGYASGILQATSMGLDFNSYMTKLGDAMYGQGMGMQDATLQMSLFSLIAESSNVHLDDIIQTLQSVSSSLRSLGVQADFGAPILSGFAKSLDDIGLGAENAGKLTTNLMSSISKIATDPSLAYITSKFGGLEYGTGGSALSASYGMQAKLLEDGGQAEFGSELVGAMRDMLSTVGGGKITTVREAAESPAAANVAYKQEQLLRNVFGVSNESSARTLEMLANLENATKMGDQELINKYTDQIKEGTAVRLDTVGELHKANATLDSLLMQTTASTSANLMILTHLTGESIDEVGDFARELLSDQFAKGGTFDKFNNDEAVARAKKLGTGDGDSAGTAKEIADRKAAMRTELAAVKADTGTEFDNIANKSPVDISSLKSIFESLIATLAKVEIAISGLPGRLSYVSSGTLPRPGAGG